MVAIYPGSFNPFHKGHKDVLEKALQVFEYVIVAQGINPDKKIEFDITKVHDMDIENEDRISCIKYSGLLKDCISIWNPDVIIKGLRNAQDLEYETTMQYWNEDLGITIPTFYVITDRNLRHISSSAIRSLEKINEQQKTEA